MRISDWSSDVCSSDLRRSGSGGASARGAPGIGSGTRASPSRRPAAPCRTASSGENSLNAQVIEQRQQRQAPDGEVVAVDAGDRKRVVEGKSVSVRVGLGDRRLIKKQISIHNNN